MALICSPRAMASTDHAKAQTMAMAAHSNALGHVQTILGLMPTGSPDELRMMRASSSAVYTVSDAGCDAAGVAVVIVEPPWFFLG